ncbi:MAG: PDZ domain-containing protein [Micromonosporaceae bacterium]
MRSKIGTRDSSAAGPGLPSTQSPLTGNRTSDWAAFAAVYQQVTNRLPAGLALRQQVAAAAMTGMVASLHDNHAQWGYPQQPPGSTRTDAYGIGIRTSPAVPLAANAPGEALPPLFVTVVAPRSPAARHGVRPGDIITAVNGAPPFIDGVVSPGVINLLGQQYPQHQTMRITLRRPATGRTQTSP